MIPQLILMLSAAALITPGEVPVVADVHPNETQWIQEIKDARNGPAVLPPPPGPAFPNPGFGTDYYPPETIEAILATFFYTEEGLIWARRVSFCESSWNINALGALGEISLFQHRPEFWANRATWAGYGPDADPWDPQINTAVAAFMYYSPDFGPSHWSCK